MGPGDPLAAFADVAPSRGATLVGGVGSSAVPMNGYPQVFNIKSDPHEKHNIGEMYNWVLGPMLKTVEILDYPKTHRP